MKLFLFISILFLHACSNLPTTIQYPPKGNLQLQQVLRDNSDYQNSLVRWGGTIIDVENKADSTKMQVLYYPLNYYGRPIINKTANGRFITESKLFLDPAIFTKGTQITVSGTLQGFQKKQIGEKSITLPIVVMDSHYIWPEYQQNYYADYGYSYHNYGYRYGRYYPYSFYNRRSFFYGGRGSYYYCD